MNKREQTKWQEAVKQQTENIKSPRSESELYNEYCETGIMPEEMVFNEALLAIKKYTGLTLSNIELAGLRRITKEINRADSDYISKKGSERIYFGYPSPITEAIARFLLHFYDFDEKKLDWQELFELNDNQESSERIKEWFRQKQKEAHLEDGREDD